jgi:hypothetical protein
LIEDELDNDADQTVPNDAKSGVDWTDDEEDNNGTSIPKELDSDLGPYWSLG